VEYLSEALDDGSAGQDGCQLLMMAQYHAIDEIMNEIIILLGEK
jgi:hypothetical protein